MALIGNKTAYSAMVELEYQKKHTLYNYLLNQPTSRQMTAEMLSQGGPGGYAYDIKQVRFTNANLGALISDAYQSVSSYSDADINPSSPTYTAITDAINQPHIDSFCAATYGIEAVDAEQHQLGPDSLIQRSVVACTQQMLDQAETQLVNRLENSGQCETGAAATPFGLRTGSQANWNTDMKDINGAKRKQDGGSYTKWTMVLPLIYEDPISRMDFFAHGQYKMDNPGAGSVVEARVYRGSGYDFIFSPGFSDDDSGFCFDPLKVALLQPVGVRDMLFQESDAPLTKRGFVYMLWGLNVMGKTIQAADGVAVSDATQKEGIIRLALS